MTSRLVEIDGRRFDALIIGGGIAGAGCARELALRGLSVALFEKGDFASGTTSKSSKLIHGGLRYLELFDVALVRESLRERERLMRLAPHLVRPLGFLVPVYRGGGRRLIRVRIGMRLYGLLASGSAADRPRTLSAVEALSLEPSLNARDLVGAGYYVDGLLLFPERLCLENIFSAARLGARVFNYAEVEEIAPLRDGARDAAVRDLLTGDAIKVSAPIVINAAGPWVDRIRAMAGVGERKARLIRPTKGSHLLLSRITERAVYLSAKDDRMLFVIPWRGFSLVGTTDTDFDGDPDRCWATREEVQYLILEARRAFNDPRVSESSIAYTYAGVRPLSWEEGKPPSKVSRQHRAIGEGERGEMISITGTKLTCYRSLAERVGDLVVAKLGRGGRSRSARVALDGADSESETIEARAWLDVEDDVKASGLSHEQIESLVSQYGRNYKAVLQLARELPEGTERLCPRNPDIVAQLHHAVAREFACSLQDFLLRRTAIGLSACQGMDCAPRIAERMGSLLGWSGRRLEAELAAYETSVRRTLRFRDDRSAP